MYYVTGLTSIDQVYR